ncbi:MAG: hypothetical protein R3C68_17655 [Myxococcota bacterium]
MTSELTCGQVELPDDWEFFSEASILPPARAPLNLPRVGSGKTQVLRPNLVIKRNKVNLSTVDKVADTVMQQLAKSFAGLKRLGDSAITFEDGTDGRCIKYSFTGPNGVVLIQEQRLRLDGAVMSALVSTVDSNDEALLESLGRVALSFRPASVL